MMLVEVREEVEELRVGVVKVRAGVWEKLC